MYQNKQADTMFETFTAMMIEELEHVQQDWEKPWFSCGVLGSPKNISGRVYNGANELFLWLLCGKEKYQYPIFATFNQINALNGKKRIKESEFVHVTKGEHSFPVLYYKMLIRHKQTRRLIDFPTYNEMDKDEQKEYDKYPMLQLSKVFNIAQTNMQEARPELWEKLTQPYSNEYTRGDRTMEIMEPVARMISEQGWICPIKEQEQDRAYYDTRDNFVAVPLRTQFKEQGGFEGTLFHEMAHSTGHKDYADRFNRERGWGDRDAYAKEELIAELTAALTLGQNGITTHIRKDSVPYLKSWLDALKETPDFLKSVLGDVKKANRIINERLEQFGKQETATESEDEREAA